MFSFISLHVFLNYYTCKFGFLLLKILTWISLWSTPGQISFSLTVLNQVVSEKRKKKTTWPVPFKRVLKYVRSQCKLKYFVFRMLAVSLYCQITNARQCKQNACKIYSFQVLQTIRSVCFSFTTHSSIDHGLVAIGDNHRRLNTLLKCHMSASESI